MALLKNRYIDSVTEYAPMFSNTSTSSGARGLSSCRTRTSLVVQSDPQSVQGRRSRGNGPPDPPSTLALRMTGSLSPIICPR